MTNGHPEMPTAHPERLVAHVPHVFDVWDSIAARLRSANVLLLLDFDGTLSPIVDDPRAAVLPEPIRELIRRLAQRCPVVIMSGRDIRDVRERVGIDGLWYAGDHGFELSGPGGLHRELEEAREAQPALEQAVESLRVRLASVDGVVLERKTFGVAVHYRMVADSDVQGVIKAVEAECARTAGLQLLRNKQVIELLPAVKWDKGAALHWIVDALELDRQRILPLYAGDDVTDESGFRRVAGWGVAVVVRDAENAARMTSADAAVDGPGEFARLLERIGTCIGATPTG